MGDNQSCYRVIVRINGGEERGGYSGAKHASEAVRSCVEQICQELPDGQGILEIRYFNVDAAQLRSHLCTGESPMPRG